MPIQSNKMLTAKEVRVGNWVMDKEGSNFIFQIESHHIARLEQYQDFRPIFLTMKLLIENCGFTDYAKNGWGCRLRLDKTRELFFGIQDQRLRYQTIGSGWTSDFNVKYLHQLQNLYYVVFPGEELKVIL